MTSVFSRFSLALSIYELDDEIQNGDVFFKLVNVIASSLFATCCSDIYWTEQYTLAIFNLRTCLRVICHIFTTLLQMLMTRLMKCILIIFEKSKVKLLNTDVFRFMIHDWVDIHIRFFDDFKQNFNNFKQDLSNVFDCVKELNFFKKCNRQMKTLLSIDEWKYSQNFISAIVTSEERDKFVSSVVQFVQDCDFYDIDIDWEYSVSEVNALNMILLLQIVRLTLDTYSSKQSLNYHFLLSIASSAKSDHYNQLHLQKMNLYLDQWNFMTYHYVESFSSFTSHQVNLYRSQLNSKIISFSTNRVINDYIAINVIQFKIQMSMSIYDRIFNNIVDLDTFFNVNSSHAVDSWNVDVWNYKVFLKINAVVQFNHEIDATYSYDNVTRQLIFYDTVDAIKQKAKYIRNLNLEDGFFWEASANKEDDESLIKTLAKQLRKMNRSSN